MNRAHWGLVVVALLVVGLIFMGANRRDMATPPLGVEYEEEWKEFISTVGPQEAYRAFAESVRDLQPGPQHTNAHFFGAALFGAVGTDGLPACDDRFSFGCYHEFLGHAIRDLGLDVVFELNARCREVIPHNPLSCQHGIGHGVQAHFGYEDAALFSSLDVCKSLPDADIIGGCYGGAFMEYNLRTMVGESAPLREGFEDPHYPCSVVEDDYVTACVFWQPQWWLAQMRTTMLGSTVRERVGEAGRLCTSSRDREHCFEGVGNIMLSEARDERGVPQIAVAQDLCEAAARTDADELRCLSIAANHFGIEVSHEAGRDVCSKLTGESRIFCENHAVNIANIANRPPFPL